MRQRFDHLIAASLGRSDCPEPEVLAAYLLGSLGDAERRAVAAHLRRCPRCRYTLEECGQPEPPARTLVARPLPAPATTGLRAGAPSAPPRRYGAADLQIGLVVTPVGDEYWRVAGRLTRAGEGQADRSVELRSGRRRYGQHSDEDGFFTFEVVPAGRYTLSVRDGATRVQVRTLAIGPAEADDLEATGAEDRP